MLKKTKNLNQPKARFEVLLEDMHSDIKLIAEQNSEHTKHFDKIESRFDKVDSRFDKIEARLEKIEDDIGIIKMDIEFIKSELKQKVNRDEFTALEKRLSLLENKFRANS